MGATYIKDIPEADHQHLQSQEREQEFVEEENYMADSEIHEDNRTPEEERIQEEEKILEDFWTRIQKIIQKTEEILEDIWTPEEERIEKREEILEDIRTREQGIQRRETKLDQIDQDYWPLMYPGFQFIDDKLDQIDQDFWTPMHECSHHYYINIRKFLITPPCIGTLRGFLLHILTHISEIIPERESNFSQIDQDFRTRISERLQKSENKTTKTTKSKPSTIKSLLLGSAFFASRFCSVGAEFIPVESDLSLCKTDLSKLTDTCDHDEVKAIHCVLNDEGELGIGCFSKTWVKRGYCPYFRNYFGVLDIRPCLGNGSICPTDQYLSNEVYKYPGCLINNSTRVLDILTNQTTESTTIRSSDAGDKEAMLLILVMILGLITVSLLLIHGLRFLRPMKINLRGLRSAYAPASMGQQDPQRDGLPDDRVDV